MARNMQNERDREKKEKGEPKRVGRSEPKQGKWKPPAMWETKTDTIPSKGDVQQDMVKRKQIKIKDQAKGGGKKEPRAS